MDASLIGLFFSALLSATLLPGGSEALLILLIHQSNHATVSLIIWASIGNIIGSLITFAMGSWLRAHSPFKPLEKNQHARAKRWIDKQGPMVLLLAWLPIIGDALCFAAGWLRLNLRLSITFISIGKFGRYLTIAYMTTAFANP